MLLLIFLSVMFVLFLTGGVVSLIFAIKRDDPGLTTVAFLCLVAWGIISVAIGNRLSEIDKISEVPKAANSR